MNAPSGTHDSGHACCHSAAKAAPAKTDTHCAHHTAHGSTMRGAHAAHAGHAHGSGWRAGASDTAPERSEVGAGAGTAAASRTHLLPQNTVLAAASVTVHCLTGCAIGEFIGLAIGVSLGLEIHLTITLAVALSFVSGFALTLLPMLRRGFGLADAFRTVWLGEVISISVMELVMNLVDYHMGGMRGVSLVSAQYWQAFAAAMVAGYLAAWPVNRWMLGRNMKKCH
ncbi:MAG: DUF4396 domain-containing protein [Nevskiaceae bacterium]|nr:MAG: DUF4396 domain-containing protein [Nevskiaceae bacterium]